MSRLAGVLPDFHWREVDIDADTELRQKYNEEVPLVFIDGRKAFKYRMQEHEFLRMLAGGNRNTGHVASRFGNGLPS